MSELKQALEAWDEKGRHVPEQAQHEDTCEYAEWCTPISECSCDCYEKYIYVRGYFNGLRSTRRIRFQKVKETTVSGTPIGES